MKVQPLAALSLLLGISALISGCSGQQTGFARAPVVDELVRPELLTRVFGDNGVETSSAADRLQYVNTLDQSTLSSADFQTTNTPVRLLKVRLSDKAQKIQSALQEFSAQRAEFENIGGIEAIPGVKVGDEAAAFKFDQGRNFRLVARLGTKVATLHVRGSNLPPDSLQALQDLALHILEEAEKRAPSPRQ